MLEFEIRKFENCLHKARSDAYAPHCHHQFFEPFLDPDVIRIEIFGFQAFEWFNTQQS
jgi:hypothetical protein